MSSVEIVWSADVQAEETLAQLGLRFSERSVRIDCIDWLKSRENRARSIFLDESHKNGIKKAMESGCTIPKIVVRNTGKGFVIVGGNHRGTAASELLESSDEIPVYVVECSDVEFQHASALLNLKNGKPLSREERLSKACDAVLMFGMTQAQAASMYDLHHTTVSQHCRAFERAAQLGVDLSANMTSALIAVPAEHVKFDALREAYGRYFRSKKNVAADQIEAIVKDVKSKNSEAEMVACIDSYTKKPSRIAINIDKPRTDLIKAVKCLATSVEKAKKLGVSFASLDDSERKEVEKTWQSIIKNMSSFR